MKKVFALIVATAMCRATLTACGGNGASSTNGAASTSVTTSQS